MSDDDPFRKEGRPKINPKAWDTEIENVLIHQVEQYPELWDERSQDSRIGSITTPLWQKIHSVVPTKVPVMWTVIRQKWRNLVTSYSSILRRKIQSGQSAEHIRVTWIHWDAMQFYHQNRVNCRAIGHQRQSTSDASATDMKIEFASTNTTNDVFFDEDDGADKMVDDSMCPVITGATPGDTTDDDSSIITPQKKAKPTSSPLKRGRTRRKHRTKGFVAAADRSRGIDALARLTAPPVVKKDDFAEFGQFIAVSLRELPHSWRKKTRLALTQLIASANSQAASS